MDGLFRRLQGHETRVGVEDVTVWCLATFLVKSFHSSITSHHSKEIPRKNSPQDWFETLGC